MLGASTISFHSQSPLSMVQEQWKLGESLGTQLTAGVFIYDSAIASIMVQLTSFSPHRAICTERASSIATSPQKTVSYERYTDIPIPIPLLT